MAHGSGDDRGRGKMTLRRWRSSRFPKHTPRQAMSPAEPLRLLILGAHPDDAEFHAGGLATRFRSAGHRVRMVSVTCGDAGHATLRGPELATLRRQEAADAARVIGAESAVWEYPDGQLEPTLELRWRIVRELRMFRPDLVLTHRTCDYHPDHRALGQAVRDAAYLVTVPALVPELPILSRPPVFALLPDRFTRPAPVQPDIVLDVTAEFATMVEMLACHRTQMFEWLPFNLGIQDQVPAEETEQQQWLRDWYAGWLRPLADRYRQALIDAYGRERGEKILLAEVFEVSEYGAPLDDATRARWLGSLGTS